MLLRHFLFGTEHNQREQRMLYRTVAGPEVPKEKPADAAGEKPKEKPADAKGPKENIAAEANKTHQQVAQAVPDVATNDEDDGPTLFEKLRFDQPQAPTGPKLKNALITAAFLANPVAAGTVLGADAVLRKGLWNGFLTKNRFTRWAFNPIDRGVKAVVGGTWNGVKSLASTVTYPVRAPVIWTWNKLTQVAETLWYLPGDIISGSLDKSSNLLKGMNRLPRAALEKIKWVRDEAVGASKKVYHTGKGIIKSYFDNLQRHPWTVGSATLAVVGGMIYYGGPFALSKAFFGWLKTGGGYFLEFLKGLATKVG